MASLTQDDLKLIREIVQEEVMPVKKGLKDLEKKIDDSFNFLAKISRHG